MYKKVKVKIVILHKSLLKLSSWWFFLFYQEFSTKLKGLLFNFVENSWYLLNILNFRYIFNMIEVDNNYGKNNSRD